MARKIPRDRSEKGKSTKPDSIPAAAKATAAAAAGPSPAQATSSARSAAPFKATLATIVMVGALLTLHYALAAMSLLQENPTVDEVVHMPAGITYWQKGTFRLYHQNPPLVKLVAALPVLWANPIMQPLYQAVSWKNPDPDQATFSQIFALANADRYFELFQLARLPMPLFSLVGGLVVFAWSRRLYGTWGGLLCAHALGLLPKHPGPCTTDHIGHGCDRPGCRGDLCLLALLASAGLAVGERGRGLARACLADKIHDAVTFRRLAVPLAGAARRRDKSSGLAVGCASSRGSRRGNCRPERADAGRRLFL